MNTKPHLRGSLRTSAIFYIFRLRLGYRGRYLAQRIQVQLWDNVFSIRLTSTFDVETESAFAD